MRLFGKPVPKANSGPVAHFQKQCPICGHDGFAHRDMRWNGPILVLSCDYCGECNCSREYVSIDHEGVQGE